MPRSTRHIGAAYAPAVPTDEAAGSPTGVFRHPIEIRWGDCDPAAIMYFPRFFERFHDAMERWFGDALGIPYESLITGRRLGLPAVHTAADFRSPCRFGERLVVELRVAKLGRSSMDLAYRIVGAGEAGPRLTGKTVCALMDLDPARPTYARAVPWPEDLRTRIEAFGVAADDHEGPA